jgi:hypothetical protein
MASIRERVAVGAALVRYCGVVAVLFAVMGVLALPAAAQAGTAYMECDNAHSAWYPSAFVAPGLCNLGLHQSYYDVRPVGDRAFATIGLRYLRWRSWGSYSAYAYGIACNINSLGIINKPSCDHALVQVYTPVYVGPANAVIYQVMDVRHVRSRAEPYNYTFWYQPGTDY